MADVKFPISVYNKDGAVLQCDNDDQLKKAKAKGYTPKYIMTHFPKHVYHKTTGASLAVADEAAMKDALAGDYTEDFVAAPDPVSKPVVEVPVVEVVDTGDSSTMRAVLEELRAALNRIEDLEGRVEDLEAAAAAPKAKGAAAKDAKAPKDDTAKGAAAKDGE